VTSETAVENPSETEDSSDARSDALTDIALTLPIFIAYHLGVAFLPTRNAADLVTQELQALVDQSVLAYALLTVGLGAAFVLGMLALGKTRAFKPQRFALVIIEAIIYGTLLRSAGAWAVGALPLAGTTEPLEAPLRFANLVLSLGAGFYEELTFRVILFGLCGWVLRLFLGDGARGFLLTIAWGVCCAVAFSAWHYVGPMADAFELKSFVYRATCGLVLTLIYALRGFAPAVWTHALYDVWVMVL
jgi:hypothetical protein